LELLSCSFRGFVQFCLALGRLTLCGLTLCSLVQSSLLQHGFQLCLAHGCLISGMLCSHLRSAFRRPLGLPVLLFKPTGFSYALHIGCALGLRLLLQTGLFLFNCLLNALARLLARLRPRFRKVAVLRAVEIGPGIKCCHIFRRVVLVVQRPSISHRSPQNFPAVNSRRALAPIAIRWLSPYGRRSRCRSNKTLEILTRNPNSRPVTEQ